MSVRVIYENNETIVRVSQDVRAIQLAIDAAIAAQLSADQAAAEALIATTAKDDAEDAAVLSTQQAILSSAARDDAEAAKIAAQSAALDSETARDEIIDKVTFAPANDGDSLIYNSGTLKFEPKSLEDAQIAAVYVSKTGDNANTGLSVNRAKLTITEAIITAEGLITAGATGVRITVIDGSTYTENITVPTAISIDAKGATLIGTASITGGSELFLDRHFANANNQSMLTCEGAGEGPAIYWANISDGRGTGGALTGVNNVRNTGGGGKNLFSRVGILYVGASGTGVGDVSSGNAGHIHIELLDLYLAGNNSIGILGSSQGAGSSNIVGWIDHIIEIGSVTGTVGISMTAVGAVVKLTASEIVADTAYNITTGSLYISCPKITGLTVGTPVQRMIGTAEAEINITTAGNILRADGLIYKAVNETTFLQSKVPFERSVSVDPELLIVWDNFNRPNGAVGVADSGQTYSFISGSDISILNKTLTSGSSGGVLKIDLPSFEFYEIQCSLKNREGSPASFFHGFIIGKDIDNWVGINFARNTGQIIKKIAGVETVINAFNVRLPTSANTVFIDYFYETNMIIRKRTTTFNLTFWIPAIDIYFQNDLASDVTAFNGNLDFFAFRGDRNQLNVKNFRLKGYNL